MTVYVALLRGINVGGNMLKMDQLREVFAEIGFPDARTYVQSGNVVFSAKGRRADIVGAIERRVSEVTRLPVAVILRAQAELQRAIEANPFAEEAAALPRTVHVTFLSSPISKAGLAAIGRIEGGADRWHAAGSEIYLHCPNGYGRSKLNNTALERALGVRTTTRNWSTVAALHAMASAQPPSGLRQIPAGPA